MNKEHNPMIPYRKSIKKMRWLQLTACLTVVVTLTGCLTAPDIERTRLYILNPVIDVEAAPPLELTLGVRPLFSARPYKSSMAYLDEKQTLAFRMRDEWAESPASSVTRALTDALAATRRFKDVGNAADMVRPNLVLTGELRMFHENRTVSPPVAELEVRVELRPSREPGTLWAQTLRITVPLSSDDAAAFAAAMNEAVADFAIRSAKVIALVEPPLSLLPKEIPRVATPQEQP